MPAFLLIFGIKKVKIPFPWFLIWLLLLPLVPVAILISPFFRKKPYGKILQNAHLGWWVLVNFHGLKIDINSKSNDRIYLSWV